MKDRLSPRAAALKNADAAIADLRRIPEGPVPTDVVIAFSTRATALALIGLTQAVVHASDVSSAARLSKADQLVELVDVSTPADAAPQYVVGKLAAEALVALGWTPPAEGSAQ